MNGFDAAAYTAVGQIAKHHNMVLPDPPDDLPQILTGKKGWLIAIAIIILSTVYITWQNKRQREEGLYDPENAPRVL